MKQPEMLSNPELQYVTLKKINLKKREKKEKSAAEFRGAPVLDHGNKVHSKHTCRSGYAPMVFSLLPAHCHLQEYQKWVNPGYTWNCKEAQYKLTKYPTYHCTPQTNGVNNVTIISNTNYFYACYNAQF